MPDQVLVCVPIPPVTANSIASIVPPIQIVSERGVVIETTGFGTTVIVISNVSPTQFPSSPEVGVTV